MDPNETFEEQAALQGSPRGHRRFLPAIVGGLLLVGVLVGAALAGSQMLGGAEGQTPTASPAGALPPREARLAFSQCMRENGIANFPDPVEDGLNLSDTGIDPNTPAFQEARAACRPLLPDPRAGSGGTGDREGSANTGDSEWEKIVPGADCECADGSEFAFFERRADLTKVVLYLDGGGVCFDAASCANANTPGSVEREGPDYDPNIEGENPAGERGMLDLGRADNPFRDYSFIYVPQCTADSHLGNVTREYAPDLTVRHKGFVNGTAALSYLVEHYPDAAEVVVVGHTTGATPIYGGLVSDRLPAARVVVFASQTGAFPDSPDLNLEIIGQWGTFEQMPDWKENQGLAARDWGARRFWIQAGLHDPEIVMARFDYAFDPNAAGALEYLSRYLAPSGGEPPDTLTIIDANEAAIEAAGVVMHSYTAPGQHHGILEFEKFYELEVNGVKLVDWIAALIAGEPPADVHCDNCATE